MGRIQFVGAGVDAESLTLGALDAIRKADVVIADNLVPQEVLDLIPKGTALYVADKKDRAVKGQEEIDLMILGLLENEKHVVRLKNGDPGVYGRLCGELSNVRRFGYTPEVSPGVSCITAAAARLQIPLTARGIADKFMVLTSRKADGSIPTIPAFDPLCTIVLLMCAATHKAVFQEMIRQGYPELLPVAVVQDMGGTKDRAFRSCIGAIVKNAEVVRSPVTMIIGWVVNKNY